MGISVRSGLDEHSLATLGIRIPIGRLTFYKEHYLKKTPCIAAIGFALIAGRVVLGDDTQPIEVDQETANALLLIGATEFIWADDSAIYYSLLGEEKCDCKPGGKPGEKLRVCKPEDCGGVGTPQCSTQAGAATAYCSFKRPSTGTIYVLTGEE